MLDRDDDFRWMLDDKSSFTVRIMISAFTIVIVTLAVVAWAA